MWIPESVLTAVAELIAPNTPTISSGDVPLEEAELIKTSAVFRTKFATSAVKGSFRAVAEVNLSAIATTDCSEASSLSATSKILLNRDTLTAMLLLTASEDSSVHLFSNNTYPVGHTHLAVHVESSVLQVSTVA